MDIKQLEAFVYVVENRSFSKAGELLHLTQPTISAHIASLEQELKIKLIERTTKETYPSDAGDLLYGYAKQILAKRQEALDAVERFTREMKGSITLAASTIPGQYFLPRMLQAFHEKYPDICFNINLTDSAEAVDQVLTRSAEIGFTGTVPTAPKCLWREFADDKLVIITPNKDRFRQYQSGGFPVRQILQETFISREKGSGTRRETESYLRQMGIDPAQIHTAVEVRSTESVKKMVSEGLGIAIVSKSAAEDYCQFGKILAFDFNAVSLRRKLYIVRHKNVILSPIAQTFYDFAKYFYQPK